MRPFRNLPIRHKVTLVVVVTSVIVLLLTCVAFITYEWVTFRRATLTNLETLGHITAETTSAALRFKDNRDAETLLTSLRAEQPIVTAALYDTTGQLFAYYARRDPPAPFLETSTVSDYRFTRDDLLLYQPVLHEGRYLGTLYIQSSLDVAKQRFLLYGGLVTLVVFGSTCVAFLLSRFLQRAIVRPIATLADTSRAVSSKRDYGMRATRYGRDELGDLTDSFNDMLGQIQERDERLSSNEERLRNALTAADMGTWRYEPRTNQSTRDENFNRLLGLEPVSSTHPIEEFLTRVHDEDRATVRAALDRAIRDGDIYLVECRIVRPDGSVRWVRDRGKVVRAPDGTASSIIGAAVDITDRKAAEEQVRRLNAELEQRVNQRTAELAQTNRDLEAFTYSVSHDLRGPLRHVSNYAQLLQEEHHENLSKDAQFYVGRIVSGTHRMSHLIDDLLNLGRVGRQPLVMQRTDLNRVVDEALAELEPEMQNRKIEWRRGRLPEVDCDPGLLRLVFANLLSNALKYSRPRDVAIVSIGVMLAEGQPAIFVRDNGVGFDPAYKHKLFGVFQRLHNSATFEGTGVGLATVERIVRNHGGRIWTDSRPNEGATFYFTLPGLAHQVSGEEL